MARGSSFWEWYATVNDDVRHQLVDRMWFGQHRQHDTFAQNVEGMSSQRSSAPPEQQASVHTKNPHVPEALDGIGMRGRDDFNAENVKNVMHEFYGHGAERTSIDEAAKARERDEAIRDFYRGPEQER